MTLTKTSVAKWITAAVLSVSVANTALAVNQPTINLLPTTVIENLKQTAAGAKAMEDNLQQVISNLDAQNKLYAASHCDGAINDAGCDQIQQQIANNYSQLLSTIDAALPEIERNVANTHQAVSQRLRTEVGLKMTPLDIEKLVRQQSSAANRSPVARKHQRLSRMFGNLAKLVSQQGRGDSMAVMASGIYWDTQQVMNDINVIKQDIAVAQMQLDVFKAYGQITPEMVGTVDNVKTLLFGDVPEDVIPTEIPPAESTFISEYER